MFSNLVDRVDNQCVFFHDLLDLLEITSGEDRGAINAGVSVLEEYGKGVEMYKVPRFEKWKEVMVGGGREGEEMEVSRMCEGSLSTALCLIIVAPSLSRRRALRKTKSSSGLLGGRRGQGRRTTTHGY